MPKASNTLNFLICGMDSSHTDLSFCHLQLKGTLILKVERRSLQMIRSILHSEMYQQTPCLSFGLIFQMDFV